MLPASPPAAAASPPSECTPPLIFKTPSAFITIAPPLLGEARFGPAELTEFAPPELVTVMSLPGAPEALFSTVMLPALVPVMGVVDKVVIVTAPVLAAMVVA